MVGRTKGATNSEKQRYQNLRRLGCICCRAKGHWFRDIQIHHITEAGRRLGNEYSIPLCPWHHQGYPVFGDADRGMSERWLGPSLAVSKKKFIAEFGTEKELLKKVDDELKELGWI